MSVDRPPVTIQPPSLASKLSSSSSSSSCRLPQNHLPGAAYRAGHLAPVEHLVPTLPAAHTYDARMTQDGEPERGTSDAGRLHFDDHIPPIASTSTSGAAALSSATVTLSNDEPPVFFWAFDGEGKPVLTRTRLDQQQLSPVDASGSTSGSRPLPRAGNRGFKLRPHASLDVHHADFNVEPHRLRFDNAVDRNDDLITANAPKWNAYGRIAPWTSGATGPLTGQGEEEVGPSGMAAGEEGEVGERRPRRGDRETNDRLRLRMAALQRAGVRSLLTSPPPRRQSSDEKQSQDGRDARSHRRVRRRSSSPLLLSSPHRSAHTSAEHEDPSTFLSTSVLAPTLLQPVLSPLDLLQSRTLRHTFRNPHIEALAKTTLDLGESEGDLMKSVGGFWAALEVDDSEGKHSVLTAGLSLARAADSAREREDRKKRKHDALATAEDVAEGEASARSADAIAAEEAKLRRRRRHRSRTSFSPTILGSAGAGGTAFTNGGENGAPLLAASSISLDELNPAYYKLEDLFITGQGLPIPVLPPGGEFGPEGDELGVAAGDPTAPTTNEMMPADRVERSEITQKASAKDSSTGGPEKEGDSTASTQSAANANGKATVLDEMTEQGVQPEAQQPMQVDGEGRTNGDVSAQEAEHEQQQQQIVLPPHSQREILLASLNCLHELAADSSEYLDRLNEVRGRLCEVRRKRDRVWRALRIWALDRLEEQQGSSVPADEEGENAQEIESVAEREAEKGRRSNGRSSNILQRSRADADGV